MHDGSMHWHQLRSQISQVFQVTRRKTGECPGTHSAASKNSFESEGLHFNDLLKEPLREAFCRHRRGIDENLGKEALAHQPSVQTIGASGESGPPRRERKHSKRSASLPTPFLREARNPSLCRSRRGYTSASVNATLQAMAPSELPISD